MFDHVGFPVKSFKKSKTFYADALAPLGFALVMEVSSDQPGGKSHAGFGTEGRPRFWISEAEVDKGNMHIAFKAKSRKAVEEFYEAALKAGGKDNGAPGLRPHYHENYYGAFVIDPDGHNIEAVCHMPK
jgi:catechol 2,3-dioxygenase-like lactoylglutathione lyase family enzyme